MSQFEVLMLRCEFDEEQRLLVSRFVNGLKVYIKQVKVHPLYSLDVTYKKALDCEKYFCVIPRHVPFNLDTRPSCPSIFPRSHLSTQPINTTSPLGSTPSASSTSMVKTTIPASSSARPVTSQIKCYNCHAKDHITSCLSITCISYWLWGDSLLEDTGELLVMDLLARLSWEFFCDVWEWFTLMRIIFQRWDAFWPPQW